MKWYNPLTWFKEAGHVTNTVKGLESIMDSLESISKVTASAAINMKAASQQAKRGNVAAAVASASTSAKDLRSTLSLVKSDMSVIEKSYPDGKIGSAIKNINAFVASVDEIIASLSAMAGTISKK